MDIWAGIIEFTVALKMLSGEIGIGSFGPILAVISKFFAVGFSHYVLTKSGSFLCVDSLCRKVSASRSNEMEQRNPAPNQRHDRHRRGNERSQNVGSCGLLV